MKRKAVEKSCEPDIRNEFSISLFRITKSVNQIISAQVLETIFKKYIPNCFFSEAYWYL